MTDTHSKEPLHHDDDPLETPTSLWTKLQERRLIRWSIDLCILAAIFWGISSYQTKAHIHAGTRAPDFELTTRDRSQLISTTSLHGKPTVLVFWAPWCTMCGAESSTISSIQSTYKDRVHVISIVLGYKDLASVDTFVLKHKVDYPVLLGHSGTQKDWHIGAFPTLYILDSKGHITYSTQGFTTWPGLAWRLLWTS